MKQGPTELGMGKLFPDKQEANAPAEAPPPEPPPLAVDLTQEQVAALGEEVVKVLHTVFDPEIPVNIYELGLVYDLDVTPKGAVGIRMTLTSPACPVAGTLPPDVEAKVRKIPNVTSAKVDVVWDPPWTKERMSEAAKLQLGIDDW
jgi:FeS assembly SUF system protein